MKLKFRADKKIWVKLGIYSVILLYVVAIAVLNLASFAFGDVDHLFHGLNPIKAFTPSYIGLTLFAYIIALIASVTSVSDKIFVREKGFGILMEAKQEKGYAKWEDENKMKKELTLVNANAETSDAAGVPLINDGKKLWCDNGEYHNIVIGSTGSGKTQMLVHPMMKLLAKKGESMIITDPKGEIYEESATELREKGYNVVVLNFRDPQKGSGWNPLTLPYELYKNGNKDKANELIDDLAANILYDENAQNSDPFWEKTSADYFSGLALALFEDASEDEINLNSINMFTTVGEEKCGPVPYVNYYFNNKDHNSAAYISASGTIIAPNDTKGSILAVFKQKLRLFAARENISEMLSHSDFDMKDIGNKKTAVFLVIQDEKKTYHSLVTIFLKQCYETLIDVAQENGGKLKYRTNFILDEFANMPPLKDVTTMITAARSRQIRFTFIIQNFAQLKQVYGEHDAETIRGNCGNIIYLLSTELASLEEISKLCGEVKSKEKDKTDSKPLVTVSDLQRFPKDSIIVIRWRRMPFKTKLTPNWKMLKENSWGKNYGKAEFPTREKHEVKVFDLKAFVDKQKADRINELVKSSLGNGMKMPDSAMPFPPSALAPKPSEPGNMAKSNVEDLLKRIDKRIAELEQEEEEEKKKSLQVDKKASLPIDNDEDDDSNNEKKISVQNSIPPQEPVKKEVKSKDDFAAKITAKINQSLENQKQQEINQENKIEKTSTSNSSKETKSTDSTGFITDDQFFDDFFADDDDYY